jgi:hypothetical protein
VAGRRKPSALKLTLTPVANTGKKIIANIEAFNVSETTVELSAPDTVVISQPHREVVGVGTFSRRISWSVEHVQPETTGLVEVTVFAGALIQTGLCRIRE